MPDYKSQLTTALKECATEDDLHRSLRLFRLREMVTIAAADLILNISLDESLKRLSELADQLILGSLHWLNQFCYNKWGEPQNSKGETIPTASQDESSPEFCEGQGRRWQQRFGRASLKWK
jgi:glutamate-ammonia-ligase adenylyltransferase